MRDNRVWAWLTMVLAGLALAACAGGGTTASDQDLEPVEATSTYQLDVQKAFEGYEPRDAAEMDAFVETALANAEKRRAAVGEKSEEQELIVQTSKDFSAANDAYRAGDYEEAAKGYRSVLDTYALHLGANVNLTLAMLQLGESEDALIQALACANLFPDDRGTLINAQVAGVACGFSTDAVEDGLKTVCDVSDPTSLLETDELQAYWDYNSLWSHIETDLNASAGDSSYDAFANGNVAYQELSDAFDDLEQTLTDGDEAALRAYLYTVGLELGYEIDPLQAEPAKGLPYKAIDDQDVCTLVLDQLTENDSTWNIVISYQLTNNRGEPLSLETVSSWQVNGEPSSVRLNGITAQAGETVEGTISFMTDGDLGSFRGVVAVVSPTDGSELARYPLAWETVDEG